MKDQVLSIGQMKSLTELRVDTSKASMCWIKNTDGDETENMYMLSVHNEWCYEMSCLSPVPTFTLQDIIKLLPKQIKGYSFLSDAANAISDLSGNVTSLADFTEEKLTNAILSSFKYQILSNALKPMYDELADMFLSGNYDASAANDWKQRLTDILNTNSKELDKIFSAFGIDPKEVGSSSQTPSSGYSVSMSQDTGDKLVGIQTGSQMRLISLDQNVARIAQWNQPVSEKFNFDTIAMPLGALSQSSLRIERMMEENRNIQVQMFYKVSDIEKWSRVLPQMNEVLGQMNGKLDNI